MPLVNDEAVSKILEEQTENPVTNFTNSGAISDENLIKITEGLFDVLNKSLYQYIELNLQKHINYSSQVILVDEAPVP